MIGATLGHYRIIEKLGQGGMGEVYLAEDPDLRRRVALKVLSEARASDEEALARVKREARLLASVAHPTIATIYGLHREENVTFIVMEYLGGGTLADRLKKRPLDFHDTLRIALDVATALECAHGRGIIHRDVKPSNIAFDGEGRTKLLDFGIGRDLGRSRATGADTTTAQLESALTREGMSLGTPAYMSPEQIRAEKLDERTDIWAFGVLLYEMLCGRNPFGSKSTPDIIAHVLERDFEPGSLPPSTPSELRILVRRCLVRDRESRLQAIGDARIVLRELLDGPPDELVPVRAAGSSLWQRLLWLLLPIAIAAGWWLRPDAGSPPPASDHFEIAAPSGLRFVTGYKRGIALSHDGRTLVFVAGTSGDPLDPHAGDTALYARRLDEWTAWKIAGTEGSASPVFSPDDEWIAFDQDNQIKKIRLSGGEAVVIADHHAHLGMDWSDDGRIAFASFARGIGVVPASGGVVDTLVVPDLEAGEHTARLPNWMPGSRHLLFTSMDSWTQLEYQFNSRIRALSLESGEIHTVIENGTDPHYIGDGRLLFAREGSIFAVELDTRTMLPIGDPQIVLDGVIHAIHAASIGRETATAQFDVADDGTLAYMDGSVFPERVREVVWIDRDGRESRVDIPLRQWGSIKLAPGESRALLSPHYVPYDVQTLDFSRSNLRRQTFEGINWHAIWGPGEDSTTIVGTREGRFVCLVQGLDTGGEHSREIELPERIWLGQWNADGDTLICQTWGGDLAFVDANGKLVKLTDSAHFESSPQLSPDGRWLAYVSNESGDLQVYARPFPAGRRAIQVSAGGGTAPIWSRDGSELYFWSSDVQQTKGDGLTAMAVSFRTGPGAPSLGRPRELFRSDVLMVDGQTNYSMDSGGRFLVIKQTPDALIQDLGNAIYPDRIRVATNWAQKILR